MVYTWKCQECEAELDLERPVAKMNEEPDVSRCPNCWTLYPNWKRIITNTTPHLRADGFGKKGEW